MVLWANLHGGFTLGLVFIVPFAIEAVMAADPADGLARQTMGLFLGVAVLAALVTPYGYRALWATYQVFGGNEALKYIIEWQPLNFARDWHAGGLILLALFAGLLSGVRLPFVRCVFVFGMTYQALSMFGSSRWPQSLCRSWWPVLCRANLLISAKQHRIQCSPRC